MIWQRQRISASSFSKVALRPPNFSGALMRIRQGEYEIDTDKRRLDIAGIHRFLSNESYWAKTRSLEQTLTAIENSLCFGMYKGREFVGFARVISDRATFAYIGDVFILESHRGKGLSKWLMKVIIEQPDMQG